MAVGDENIIEHDVVKISPDLSGFRAKLLADLEKAVKGVTASVKIKLVADATGFNLSAKEELAKQAVLKNRPTYKIRLVADGTGFNGTAKQVLKDIKSGATVRIKTTADKASAEQAQRDVEAGLKRIEGSSLRLADDINKNISKKLHDSFLIPKNAESITTGLRRARTESEKLAADVGKAAEHDLDKFYKDLGERFDQQLKGKKAAAKAVGDSFADLGRRFSLDLGGQRATAAADADRRRKDDAYAALHEKNNRELSKSDAHYAAEEIRIRHETENAVNAVARRASGLRIAVMEAEAKVRRHEEDEAKRSSESSKTRASQARSALDGLDMPKLISFGGAGIQPMNLLIAAAVAASPVLIAMATNAASAATSIAALGTSAIGAGLAIGGLTIAFNGVQNLFQAYTALESEQKTAAATAASSAKTQAGGYNQLSESLLAVADARENLVAAQKDEVQAQNAVNKAREKARRDVIELRQSILDLQNAERGDVVTLAEARQRAASVQANFFATDVDKARANQDVRDALTSLSDDRLKLAQKRADLLKANRQGIEGSDDVTGAKDAAAAAARRVHSAQRSLNRQINQSNTVQAGQSQKVSAAQAAFNEQMRRASPAAREMLGWYKANEDELHNLAKTIQQGVLPGFNTFLQEISVAPKGQKKTTLQIFAEGAAELGGIIGRTVGKLGKWTNSPFFRAAFGKIQGENAKDLQKLADAGLALLDPITRIVEAASPLAGKLADGIEKFAIWFADVIKTADDKGRLADWFEKAGQRFGTWVDIGKNLLTILKDIFTGALPTGDSFVTRFEKLTADVAKWTSSGEGQRKITAFFDFFKNLDWGQVTRTAVSLGELFLAMKALSTLRSIGASGAILAGLTAFAAANPAAAASALNSIGSGIEHAVKFLADHEVVLGTFLSIVAAAKVGKAIGFSLKLPVLDSIKGFLVGKFSVLEKFVGGGANAATMTVHAGVVNIHGSVATKPGGGTTVVGGGGKESKFGKTLGGLRNVGGVATAAVVGIELIDAALYHRDEIQRFFTMELPNWLFMDSRGWSSAKDAFINTFGKDIAHWFSIDLPNSINFGDGGRGGGGWAGLADNIKNLFWPEPSKATTTGQQQEGEAFRRLQRVGPLGASKGQLDNAQEAGHFGPLQDYITARKKSVLDFASAINATNGPTAAVKAFKGETEKSVTTMSLMLQQFGWTKDAADKYARKVYGANDATGTFGAGMDTAKGKAKDLTTQADILWNSLKGVSGNWVANLSMPGFATVKAQLLDLLSQQFIAENPHATREQISEDRREKSHFLMATGGAARGPGTGTSDEIPAWLSNGEHVWTAREVKNVGGQDAMYRMRAAARTGAFRYAKGGAVTNVPVNLDMSGTALPIGFGGGIVSGDQAVAAIAEATARSMRATDKQLIALIEAGLVESGLHNLNYGDRDSLGFLQQRAGWGSVKQRMNVAAATRKFIDKAKGLDGGGLTAGQLAQAVQVSAYPDRYDKRYADAIAVLNSAAPYVMGGMGGGPLGGMVGGRGWQWEEAVLRQAFGKGVQFYSTTGGKHASNSWHYKGRALDLTPSMAIFDWIKSHYGASTQELIYGPAGIGIRHGQPYNFGAGLNAQHRDHIHWAYANGGAVRRRTYDGGGELPPGYTMAFNGTGRTETVRTANQEAKVATAVSSGPTRIDRRDMAVLASHIVTALTGQSITMDGRKVAETVRGYDYLPRGL